MAKAKPTRHESTAADSEASESADSEASEPEYAYDGSCSQSESDASILDELSDGLGLSDSDWRGSM